MLSFMSREKISLSSPFWFGSLICLLGTLLTFCTRSILAEQSAETLPWKINKPIVVVKKELFVKHPRPMAAALASQHYVGPNLEKLEYHGLEIADDVPTNHRWRFSRDNGRTWEPFELIADMSPEAKGVGGGPTVFDPNAGMLVGIGMRQFDTKGLWNN